MAHNYAAPGMDSLPPELVTEALGYLNHADLRAAAAVSRTFRAAAWRAGLYIKHTVNVYDTAARRYAILEKVVEHVVNLDLRLGLTINFHSVSRACKQHPSGESPLEHPEHRILASIAGALPVLVSLSINVPPVFVPTLVDALRHPAQHVRSFRLAIGFEPGAAPQEIPTDLFEGSAPRLRELHLADVALPRDCVRAFARVRTLGLAYRGRLPDIYYGHHFPRLEDLELTPRSNRREPPPRALRLEGVRLRRLRLDDRDEYPLMPTICNSLDLAAVASVEHVTKTLDWADPLWARPDEDEGPVNVRLFREEETYADFNVVVVPAHRRWRRAYTVTLSPRPARGDPLPGVDLPRRLAYLRMGNAQIYNLFATPGVALRALRTLQIDVDEQELNGDYLPVVWPDALLRVPAHERPATRNAPTGRDWQYIECDALETLALFGVPDDMLVDAGEVVCLAHALAQFRRCRRDRAALVLVGVEVTKLGRVKRTFSAVHEHRWVDPGSPAAHDAGLWDDEVV